MYDYSFALRKIKHVARCSMFEGETRKCVERMEHCVVLKKVDTFKCYFWYSRSLLQTSLLGSTFFSDRYLKLIFGNVDHHIQQLVVQTGLLKFAL